MKITRRQLRRIIREVIEYEDPRHIVDAETGEIYAGPGMRADFEIWLAKNPEYVEAPPAIPAEWDKTDDFYVEPKMVR